MRTLEELRQIFRRDRFATGLGMAIDQVSPGCAQCSVALKPAYNNAAGATQGGFIFTLVDFTFAVAANLDAPITITLDSQIHYVASPKGERLMAKATALHQGQHTSLFQIEVRDDLGNLVASASATGYNLHTPPAGEKETP